MKILVVSIGVNNSLLRAFKGRGEVLHIDWTPDRHNVDATILQAIKKFTPDLTFMQLQGGDVIKNPAIIAAIPGFKVNWTGDVRHPLPQWFKTLAPYFDLTLFSNMQDVDTMNALGYKAGFIDVGFDTKVYKPKGLKVDCPEIVFFGNNYGRTFPLSRYRADMVNTLKSLYHNRFGVYGTGWNTTCLNNDGLTEAAIYRSCKIAINVSHFSIKRYSSDRILRLMGSGAFCLSHKYPDMHHDFTEGEHLVTFDDFKDLRTKIDYYLNHDPQRELIAERGCAHVHTNCTWEKRLTPLFDYARI